MNRSLKSRLTVWLAVIVGAIALATGGYSYVKAFDDAAELQDDQLRQMAALIDHYETPVAAIDAAPLHDVDADFRVQVQELGAPVPPGLTRPQRKRFLDLPASLPDGLQSVMLDSGRWRVFVRALRSGKRIAVAQKAETRDEVAGENALRAVLPFAIVIPAMLLAIIGIVHGMFGPVRRLSSEIDRRAETDLQPIDDSAVPRELLPFVAAMNGLMARMQAALMAQRRFVADAAHELRSPLTALVLQAERLEAAEMPATARERVATLRGGLRRSASLLDQLLTLARLQAPCSAHAAAPAPVSLRTVFRRVAEDLMPLAEAKAIDFGVAGDFDAPLCASELDLATLVRNLADNALRYTPARGRVDLRGRREAGAVVIEVEDSGPGIPEPDLPRVFDPFFRGLGHDETGSGLGLAIVSTVAGRLGATVSLHNLHRDGRVGGLIARVVLSTSAGAPSQAFALHSPSHLPTSGTSPC